MLEKGKLVVIRVDKAIIAFPYTVSRMELRLRNVIMNHRNLLQAIAHF